MLVIGFALTGGSLMLWPQGLFDLVSEAIAWSLVFIALGAALLAGGVAAIRLATRRLARLKNNLVEVGKAHSVFVNEPEFQLLTIGSSGNWCANTQPKLSRAC